MNDCKQEENAQHHKVWVAKRLLEGSDNVVSHPKVRVKPDDVKDNGHHSEDQ